MMTPIKLASSTKWAFTTRRVPFQCPRHLSSDLANAAPGDLLLARVGKIGSHKRLQTREGRYSKLFVDDLVIAACGARYATDQFEGVAELQGPDAALLASGGVIGSLRFRNGKSSAPTNVQLLGRLADVQQRIINLEHHGLDQLTVSGDVPIIGVLGSSMNAGKTDTAAWLIHGLVCAGWQTAGIKLTGTGSFGDVHAYLDAGASVAIDFTDAGMASTYLEPIDRITSAFETLIATAVQRKSEAIVVELADGVTQLETSGLLGLRAFVDRFDGFILSAADPMAARAGLAWLSERRVTPLALSGLLTRSPLAIAELNNACDLPILSRELLSDPANASALFQRALAARPADAA